ncbi:hypothetical protein BACPEC_01916 [[Bacteroides] pectinophilus ATCC 43243]|uniref:Uncharacterized protein n=1 Tax=[Bacteroides] pectinophilus ATCC 43243 TaxID=483218 RepID=B7AS61_9FIRM|nr:hypothetical protein BACPEC_01916 [[Bacteroides] pectinophilus ATCC 43243]
MCRGLGRKSSGWASDAMNNTNNTNKNSEHPVHDRLLGVLLYVSYMHIIR